jgi:hypothetical protein
VGLSTPVTQRLGHSHHVEAPRSPPFVLDHEVLAFETSAVRGEAEEARTRGLRGDDFDARRKSSVADALASHSHVAAIPDDKKRHLLPVPITLEALIVVLVAGEHQVRDPAGLFRGSVQRAHDGEGHIVMTQVVRGVMHRDDYGLIGRR